VANDRERDSDRTTIVTRDGDGRGGAVIILVVAVIILLLAVLFFAGAFNRDDAQDLNVDMNTPDVNVIVPPTQAPLTPMPEVQSPPPNVNVNVTTPPPEPTDNLTNTTNTLSNSG
jgi:hypothetical protein